MDQLSELAAQLGLVLQQQQRQVSTAESCTGGGIAEAITRIAGSSEWFEAGYVTYSNRQKSAQLGVPAILFEQVGAVSREVVEAMALGAQQRSGAFFSVAVSGVAGPGGGSPAKPVGTVWFAWSAGNQQVSRCEHFAGDRQQVREQAVMCALRGVLRLAAEENAVRG